MDDGQSLRTNEDHLSSDSEGMYGSTMFSLFQFYFGNTLISILPGCCAFAVHMGESLN